MLKRNLFTSNLFPNTSLFDLIIIFFLMIGGFFYLHDVIHWSVGYIGETQSGDAAFWWNGAIHLSQGIFQDSPGKGYRPGYFLLTGLTLPIFGFDFKNYYPFFLSAFLVTCSLFYLSLRSSLGKIAAASAVFIIVINPYTAEWLSTSTTDSTGLFLNIAALTCLFFALNKNLNLYLLAFFGIFFALGNLTRPLMTPFIGFSLVLLFYSRLPLTKRVIAFTVVLLAFCLPLVSWTGIQKITIDRWSISSNDASAFYGASDPNMQAWNAEMYVAINKLIKSKYHINPSQINDKVLNEVFWKETFNNYVKYYQYHLNRIFPHIWALANFSPSLSSHGTNIWRIGFLEILLTCLTLFLLFQGLWLRVITLIVCGITIYLFPWCIATITLLGAFLALLSFNSKNYLPICFISLYWLTGVISLYFVGSTFGPPLSTITAINALGYRLFSQVFFANDILAIFFFVWVTQYKNPKKVHVNFSSFLQYIYHKPLLPISRLLTLGLAGFLMMTLFIYSLGSFIVIKRAYAQLYAPIKQFPPLNEVMKFYKNYTGNLLIEGKGNKGNLDNFSLSVLSKQPNQEIIFTGTVSPFMWTIPGQQRTQVMVYAQNQISPYTMGPGFLFIEVPANLAAKDWLGIQGAFIIKNIPNHHEGIFPYYTNSPTLQTFIPLAENKMSFNISKAISFPTIKNASQLESCGEMQCSFGKITWNQDLGVLPYQRRFLLTPKNDNAQLVLKIKFNKPSLLTFKYYIGSQQDARLIPLQNKQLKVFLTTKNNLVQIVKFRTKTSLEKNITFQNIKIPIQFNSKQITINFNGIPKGYGVWIYEFNLTDNFSPQRINFN